MSRLFVIGVVIMWFSAMTALFVRDVWPAWSAQDVPQMTRQQLGPLEHPEQQYGIFTADGERIGTSWTDVTTRGKAILINGTILLDGVPLIPSVRVETTSEFEPAGGLDSFYLDVYGVPMTQIRIHGEKHGIFFPCELQIGPLHRQANLDLAASRMIGESLRPFSVLPTLKVGQAWRMQLIDPVSVVMSRKTQFKAIVAQVTGKETIQHLGRPVECFVVKTSPRQIKAWTNAAGQVLVQHVEIPGLGKVIVRQEIYDKNAREDAQRRIPATPYRNGPRTHKPSTNSDTTRLQSWAKPAQSNQYSIQQCRNKGTFG